MQKISKETIFMSSYYSCYKKLKFMFWFHKSRTSSCMKNLVHSLSYMSVSSFQCATSIKTLVGHRLYPQALKASTNILDLHLIEQIYSLFIKSGFCLDIFLGSSLIDRLSKHGNLHHAHRLLLDMSDTDIVVWNALISGYARAQQSEPAFLLFDKLRYSCLIPDVFTLSSLIKACNCSEENEVVHVVAVKMGFTSSGFVISGLIDNYSQERDMGSAKKCFEEFFILDIVVWTTMISGYLRNGEPEMAQETFMGMRLLGMTPNQFSLTSVLGAISDIKEGGNVHGLSIKIGLLAGASIPLSNAIMSMYCNCGSNIDGIKMFDEIVEPDVVSWTARIGAAHDGKEALELFRFLCSSNLEINEYTITNVLSSIENVSLLKPGKQVQACCCKVGYITAISVGNALISMYGKCQLIEEARQVFDEMLQRDCVSWNALIAVYAENKLGSSALKMFSWMRHCFFEPTKYTLASVLDVLAYSDFLDQAKQIHAHIIKLGFLSDDSMVTSLITTYGKCGDIENSKQIFSEINDKYAVHVSAMAATFVHAGYHADAVKFFKETWDSKVDVDGIIFSIVLKTCGVLTTLEQGKSLHSLALKYGIDQDNFTGSAIVDVYCKCGSIDDAEKAFKEMQKNSLAAWNAIIMGHAQHGHSDEVFKLFNEMPKFSMQPDEITYLGVLYSCCHAGLVEEAYTHLSSMFECHGLMPQLEHYACMVDLLGRVGDLDEAKKIIDQMVITPDIHIWQILLSACNIHGNVELGKIAAQKLLELRPENHSAYVVLSNLHASAGMWDEVEKLRKIMKEKVITKEPGCSWIQVKGTVHSFFANDQTNIACREIYSMLQELNKQMREQG